LSGFARRLSDEGCNDRSVIVRRGEAYGDRRNRLTDFDVPFRRMTG